MKLRRLIFLSVFLLASCSTTQKLANHKQESFSIDKSRLINVPIECEKADGTKFVKNHIFILDTYKESFLNIIKQLRNEKFPIYVMSCYADRMARYNHNEISLHNLSAAIDINYLQNPYFNAVDNSLIPNRDDPTYLKIKSLDKTYSIENEDYFINREVLRPGMITEKEAKIFAKNGFTIWGGKWRRPMDFMHFQTTKAIAKIVAKLNSKKAAIFWKTYLKDPEKIAADPFFAKDIKPEDIELNSLLAKMEYIIKCK